MLGDDGTERWNRNIHYHPVILDAVPDGCRRALDVGCGEGVLTRQLQRSVPDVIGIDLDEPSIELALQHPDPGSTYVHGDILTHDFAPGSFDFVASVAALHHMDAVAGLERMAALLRPGGVLAVVGLARARVPYDLAHEIAGAVAVRMHMLHRSYWEISAPTVWPPPVTYGQMRAIAEETLPGVRYRRHVMRRYSLVWTKPSV